MEKEELLYEGKAKKVYKTDNPNLMIIHYKDDATAFNGVKRASLSNKGIYNCEITALLFKRLENRGIPTHFIQTLNDRSNYVRK